MSWAQPIGEAPAARQPRTTPVESEREDHGQEGKVCRPLRRGRMRPLLQDHAVDTGHVELHGVVVAGPPRRITLHADVVGEQPETGERHGHRHGGRASQHEAGQGAYAPLEEQEQHREYGKLGLQQSAGQHGAGPTFMSVAEQGQRASEGEEHGRGEVSGDRYQQQGGHGHENPPGTQHQILRRRRPVEGARDDQSGGQEHEEREGAPQDAGHVVGQHDGQTKGKQRRRRVEESGGVRIDRAAGAPAFRRAKEDGPVDRVSAGAPAEAGQHAQSRHHAQEQRAESQASETAGRGSRRDSRPTDPYRHAHLSLQAGIAGNMCRAAWLPRVDVPCGSETRHQLGRPENPTASVARYHPAVPASIPRMIPAAPPARASSLELRHFDCSSAVQ